MAVRAQGPRKGAGYDQHSGAVSANTPQEFMCHTGSLVPDSSRTDVYNSFFPSTTAQDKDAMRYCALEHFERRE